MRNDMTDRRRDRIRGERPEVTDDEPGHQSFSSFGLVTLMLPSFHSRRRPGPATGRPGRYAVTRRGKGRNVRRTGMGPRRYHHFTIPSLPSFLLLIK